MIRFNKIIFIIILFIFYFNGMFLKIRQIKNLLTKQSPKISVIIPIYNGGKYLNRSLKSVQDQTMKEIEIIIIDDNSSDNSLEIIHKYMKNDKRIKLIENKTNRKILYCKSIGVLNSKGKYIIVLDQDDMFINDDAFDIIYNVSEKYDLDILQFNINFGHKITDKNKDNNNNIINSINIENQPKLKNSLFRTNFPNLWGNLFRADLYKKVIYNLWSIIINYKIIFEEDFIIIFFILIHARNYGHIKNIFFYHFINKESASSDHLNNSEYFLSVLFAANLYYDYYIDLNTQDIQSLLRYINWISGIFQNAKKLFPPIFNFLFGKILSNEGISISDKFKLMNSFKISENCDKYEYMHNDQNHSISEFKSNIQYSKIYKISIIIIFSIYKNAIKLINSINIQNINYLEIILIYDDIKEIKDDYNLIEKYIQPYKHIKLIYNENRKGSLFSIYKGSKVAKGKYIMILDETTFFMDKNTLQNIYDMIENDDLDIFEINLYKVIKNKYLNLYRCKHFSTQFNLTQIKFNLEYNEIDINKELLTNKLIKADFFDNIIKNYKIHKIKEKIDLYYNDIFSFLIESIPHKYKYISSINIYKNNSDFEKIKLRSFPSEQNDLIKETIFFVNFIFDNSENTIEMKEKVLKEFLNVLNIMFNRFIKVSKSSINLFNKFFYCKYISDSSKNMLKFYYNSLIK